MPIAIVWNRKPLPMNAFAPLPLTAIRPRDWFREKVAACVALDIEDQLIKACLLGEKNPPAVEEAIDRLLEGEGNISDAELRALLRYHGVSADKRVPMRLLRYAKALHEELLDGFPWDALRAARVGELLRMALWLYNITGQKVLLELCRLIKAQAPDWMSTFHIFPQSKPVVDAPGKNTDAYARIEGKTIAAALKVPALQALFEGGLKNETAFRVGWEKLMRYHGAAHGLFNADPLLAGANPSREVDPETVSETLRSLETLLWALGNPACADALERVAYNALPGAHGMQAANQLEAGHGLGAEGLLLFAASLWMASQDGGLAAIGYAPCEMRWRVAGKPVRIVVETNYPYEETVTLRILVKAPVAFPLHLRIPAFAEDAFVTVGEEAPVACPQGFVTLEREWQPEDRVVLTLPMPVTTVQRYHQSVSVERGPVTFALPVEADMPWNMALLPQEGFSLALEAGIPLLSAKGAVVEGWRKSGKRPAAPPIMPAVAPEAVGEIRLKPYGETTARIAQFPVGNRIEHQEE